MTSDALPTLEDLLVGIDALVAVGATGLGAVAGVAANDRIEVAAIGTGLRGPMRPGAVIELHCAAKPLVALAAALAVERSAWDPVAPVGGIVAGIDQLEPLSIIDLVNHGARLAHPAALHWIATPPRRRPRVGDLRQLEPGLAAYSEVAGGIILAEVVAALAGTHSHEVVDLLALGPLGVLDEVSLSSRPIGQRERLEPVFAGLPVDPRPMLHPFHPSFLGRQEVAFGGYGTAEAYLTVVAHSFELLCASPVLATNRGRTFDQVLRRELDLRGGFLVAGSHWRPGLLFSVTSVANLVVAVLPERRWAAFVFLNGLVAGREDAAFVRRVVFSSLLERR